MKDLEYYKSLVSDEEVIKALVKESKAREGEAEKVRVRPNMNFFQRTVSSVVSSNKRITIKHQNFTAKQKLSILKYKMKDIKSRQTNAQELKEDYSYTDIPTSNNINKQDRHFPTPKKDEACEEDTLKKCIRPESPPQTVKDDDSIQVDISDSSILCLSDDNVHNSVIIIDSDDTGTNKETINKDEFLNRKRKVLKRKRKKLEESLKSLKSKKKSKSHDKSKTKSKDKCVK